MEIQSNPYPRYNYQSQSQHKKTKSADKTGKEDINENPPLDDTVPEEAIVEKQPGQNYIADLFDDTAMKKYEALQGTKKAMESYAEALPLQTKMLMIKMLFKQIEMLYQETYTAESWNKLMNTYKNAKEALQRDDLTPERVQKQITELRAAITGLEVITPQEKEEEEEIREKLPLILESENSTSSQESGLQLSGTNVAASPDNVPISS